MRGCNSSSEDFSSGPVKNRRSESRSRKALSAAAMVSLACKAVVENLETRTMLSSATGFTATFFGASYRSLNSSAPFFPAPNTGHTGDFTVNLQTVNSGSQQYYTAPVSGTPSTFNPAQPGQQGNQFSAEFQAIVTPATSGYYTFYATSDDGSALALDGTLISGNYNIASQQGPTPETLVAPSEWLAGSHHTVDYLYENGGGGWQYTLQWSVSAPASGGGSDGANDISAGAQYVANSSFAAVTPTAPIYTPPTPTQASATDHSITLNWAGSDDATQYIVEESAPNSNSGFTAVATVASNDGLTNSYIATGLSASKTYYFKLESENFAGTGPTGTASAGLTTTATDIKLATPALSVAPSGTSNNVVASLMPMVTR
jgi:hypothetical protein